MIRGLGEKDVISQIFYNILELNIKSWLEILLTNVPFSIWLLYVLFLIWERNEKELLGQLILNVIFWYLIVQF